MATTVDSRRETVSLIGSDKVDGTAVYGADDRKIGSVQRVMIDKISGKVAYAVISFGGFLGMGEDYYPLPWSNLKYDTNLGGYRVGITEEQLKGAPKYTRSTEWDWSDRARDREVSIIIERLCGIERLRPGLVRRALAPLRRGFSCSISLEQRRTYGIKLPDGCIKAPQPSIPRWHPFKAPLTRGFCLLIPSEKEPASTQRIMNVDGRVRIASPT